MKLVPASTPIAAQRRIYFHVVDAADGMTPRNGEAGGQPQISTDGATWTNIGISTLTLIGNGRYYADLTEATISNPGATIQTRYKSNNTAEAPGDSVLVMAINPFTASMNLQLAKTANISGFNDISTNDLQVAASGLDPAIIAKIEASEQILLVNPYVPGDAPVIITPDPSPATDYCRVYGEFVDNLARPLRDMDITFRLVTVGAGGLPSYGPRSTVRTDTTGKLRSTGGDPWIELRRNDIITPSGSYYLVSIPEMNTENKVVKLTTPVYDLTTII